MRSHEIGQRSFGDGESMRRFLPNPMPSPKLPMAPLRNRLFRFHFLDFYSRISVLPVHLGNRETPPSVLNKLTLMRYVPELRQQKSGHRFKSRITWQNNVVARFQVANRRTPLDG